MKKAQRVLHTKMILMHDLHTAVFFSGKACKQTFQIVRSVDVSKQYNL